MTRKTEKRPNSSAWDPLNNEPSSTLSASPLVAADDALKRKTGCTDDVKLPLGEPYPPDTLAFQAQLRICT